MSCLQDDGWEAIQESASVVQPDLLAIMGGQTENVSEDEHVQDDEENVDQQFFGEDQSQGSASSSSWCGLSDVGI